MRSPFRSIESRHDVDAPDYKAPREPDYTAPREPYGQPKWAVGGRRAVSALAAAGSLLGAALIAIAVFLPYVETPSILTQVRENTMIQQGGWWLSWGQR